jgi:energy-coupling factor transport system substrate-specific component
MSWQLASFLIVLGALGVGLWWYERSHPPAKLLAVVATMAALAALGRDAFAAIPDVKPITTIVMVSGVAFGAGPGFAVGAIAGLASNVLLGQGPWTPWQMLGWGLVGLVGAALSAVLGSRRPPPLLLALTCAVAAEVFNLVVDVYTWTGTGAHTLVGFGLVLGQAAVFDATHVVASFLFAIAFGQALLSMLERVRGRLHVRWDQAPLPPAPPRRRRIWLGAPIAGLLVAVGVPVAIVASSAHETPAPIARTAKVAIAREVSYLARAQDADGGFGAAPGQEGSELYSAWVAMGLAAAGRDPLTLTKGSHSVLDALRGEASSLEGAGDLERTILALHACGVSPASFPGGDLVTRLLAYRRANGSFQGLSNLTAFAILALRAAGYGQRDATIQRAASWLARQQDADGGFGFATKGAGSDVDDTAAVMQALKAAGPRWQATLARSLSYMRGAQNPDGGFPEEPGGASNAQSTSWAVQALVATGRDPAKLHREGSRSPLGYLESLLQGDGSVRYSRTGTQTPVWVTAQALTALAERPFPIPPVR